MIYNNKNIKVPHEKRQSMNDKIIQMINTNTCEKYGVSKEDVFNVYTGDGGLHGLNFNDFNSFHDFTEAKKDIEQGQFFTPHGLSKYIVDCLKPNSHDIVADMTCGMGNFFNYIENQGNIYGNELDIKAYKVAKYLYPNANITNQDIRRYDPDIKFDLVIGNPPFNLKWEDSEGDSISSQLYFCDKSYKLLNHGGLMAIIVPLSFLKDDFFNKSDIEFIDNRFNFIYQMKIDNNSFKNLGVVNFDMKIIVMQKRSELIPHTPYNTTSFVALSSCDKIYHSFIEPLYKDRNILKTKLKREEQRERAVNGTSDFYYNVEKMLFQIKHNPKVASKYADCKEFLNMFENQKQPEGMSNKEWDKIKITQNKVISKFKRVLKSQHDKPKDEIKLVKTDYGLKLKAYSNKSKNQLGKMSVVKQQDFYSMVYHNDYPFEDKKYYDLFLRKRKEFLNQSQNFNDMYECKNIDKWLNDFTLTSNNNDVIKLKPIQKIDTNKMLQKNYGIINWEMGGGKTIFGIAWLKYRLEMNSVKNVFIVSQSISINLTWAEELKRFGLSYKILKTRSDVKNIRNGEIVLCTYGMVSKYSDEIKEHVKKCNQNIGLIVDESDDMTNYNSKRTRTVKKCFRKAKYKVLTTGTTTRNNINEIYSQLELIYNNSVNMMCECENIYEQDKKTGEIKEKTSNRFYMKPFDAYFGNNAFKSCFNPSKQSVFGIEKQNQDVYNSEHLKDIISKTIITRTLEEISGRKLYNINSIKVSQTECEKEVYSQIVDEFYKFESYFNSTGNSRKDTMLKAIRQIQLLIKSVSTPQLFSEYSTTELPSKFKKVIEYVNENNEKIAIGTVFKDTANLYVVKLKENCPDRQVFYIDGSVSMKKRKKIIGQFEATKNGILVSTQQSLKSSVNIPSCNKVLIETMPWNFPKLKQYFFRFVRLNSEKQTEINILMYDGTIENNIFALLLAKEKLNEFIKTLNFSDDEELYSDYGVDMGLLDSLMTKQYDEEGKVRISWGKQKIK